MALRKTITDARGITTTYHKISDISIRPGEEDMILRTTVMSYTDEEVRRTNPNLYVEVYDQLFNVTMAELETIPVYTLAYDNLKKLSKFYEAENC